MYSRNLEFLDNIALKQRLERITLEESSKKMSYCMTPSNDYLLMKDDVPFDDINNPREAVRGMLKSVIKNPMEKNDIIITFGIGLCYLLDEVYNTYPSRILVYEPDIKLLHFVLNNVDISEHLSSGRVYLTDNLDELMHKLSEIYITKDKVEVVYLKNYAVVKSPELMALTQKVYETCRSKIIDVNTIQKYSKRWLLNTLRNISLVNSSSVYKLSDLFGKFSGQTALILAAGPSLSENIEKIKANRDKYVIFAVNKVLRVLETNNITPDFVVCLDASSINATLTGLEDFCAKTNCIMDIKSDSILLSKGFKKIFITFSTNDMVTKSLAGFNKIQPLECGGTATSLAFTAAIRMGFSKIAFAGLDMAFKDDIIYSTGEVAKKISESQILVGNTQKKQVVKVKSVTGESVNTREDYAAFIQHFETLIKDSGYTEVYNTTSFGAAIAGMKNVSFDELPLFFTSTGTPFILGEVKPFKIAVEEWAKEELKQINNVISILTKGVFSPALVSSIVKSPLMYQYMQAEVLKVLQSKFETGYADEFIENTKSAVKEVVENLQKNRLI